MRKPVTPSLFPEHVLLLEKIASSGISEVDMAQRANMILMKAKEMTYDEIADVLGVCSNTVYRWVKRYATQASSDSPLEDLLSVASGRGRSPQISGDDKTWVLNQACTKPFDFGYAAETWSLSALTEHIRTQGPKEGHERLATIGKTTVTRILAESGIKPHKI